MIFDLFWPVMLAGVVLCLFFGFKGEEGNDQEEMKMWDLEMYDE